MSELKFKRLHDNFSILISRCRMQTHSTCLSVDMVITVAFRALQTSWNQTTLQLICFQTRAASIRDSTSHRRRTCSRTQVENHITWLWKLLDEFNQKTHWLLTWIESDIPWSVFGWHLHKSLTRLIREEIGTWISIREIEKRSLFFTGIGGYLHEEGADHEFNITSKSTTSTS